MPQTSNYRSIDQANTKPENECVLRRDGLGIWSMFKAWYLFALHLAACGGLVVVMSAWIDGHYFKTGSPPSLFRHGHELYQTEVVGLISTALVLIRLLAGCCTTLLVWRTIFILLEKSGITLAEICHVDSRIPLSLRRESAAQLFWSCFAMTVVLLLWPSSLASPLASSSVAWIPSSRPAQTPPQIFQIKRLENATAHVEQYLYEEAKMTIILNALSMAEKDPAYAFNRTGLPLRRYFSLTPKLTAHGLANITLPYFEITNLEWIDAQRYRGYRHVGDPAFSAVTSHPFSSRLLGNIAIMMDKKWSGKMKDFAPRLPEKVEDKKIIAIQVSNLEKKYPLENGTHPTAKTPCLPRSKMFGELPSVKQSNVSYTLDDEWAGKDCYLIGEVSIRAGMFSGTNCETSNTATSNNFATCEVERNWEAATSDWLVHLTLNTMSEVMKSTVVLNFTHPWQNDLEIYTSGMLTLAYHATWSAITERLSWSTEPISTIAAKSVVLASVDKTKLYGWLAMNATLMVSAVLVAIAQSLSKAKTIRNTTLAALTLDLSEVTHDSRVPGLCNAVDLSKKDKKLRRMVWEEASARKHSQRENEAQDNGCYCRRVVLQDTES